MNLSGVFYIRNNLIFLPSRPSRASAWCVNYSLVWLLTLLGEFLLFPPPLLTSARALALGC